MTDIWPVSMLGPTSINVDLVPRPIGGGPALSGGSQFQQSGSGCWYITYTGVSVGNAQKIRCWRAMDGILQGPVTPVIVSALDLLRAPWPLDGGGNPIIALGGGKFSDGALFDDGSGFYSETIEAELASGIDYGDTTMQLEVVTGSDLDGGNLFSIGENLYRVVRILDVDRSGAHPIFTCRTLPEARVPAAAGDAVDFNNPSCRMTLIDGNQMPLSLTAGLLGSQTIQFIEDLRAAA